MAIDYDAGRGRRGAYQNLALALQDRLDAQNKREAEDIKRRGLFGSGITQQDLNTLASTGMDIAKFGDERRTRQLDRAQQSFDRRMAEMQKRYQFYKDRADKGGSEEDMAVARGLMDQMAKERTRFEDAYGTYSGKSLFETSLGGDAVGYTGADTDATKKQIIEQAMANRQKPQPNAGGQDDALIPASFVGDFSRFKDNPGEMDDEFDDGMMGGVTTPVQSRAGYGSSEAADKAGGSMAANQRLMNMRRGQSVSPQSEMAAKFGLGFGGGAGQQEQRMIDERNARRNRRVGYNVPSFDMNPY